MVISTSSKDVHSLPYVHTPSKKHNGHRPSTGLNPSFLQQRMSGHVRSPFSSAHDREGEEEELHTPALSESSSTTSDDDDEDSIEFHDSDLFGTPSNPFPFKTSPLESELKKEKKADFSWLKSSHPPSTPPPSPSSIASTNSPLNPEFTPLASLPPPNVSNSLIALHAPSEPIPTCSSCGLDSAELIVLLPCSHKLDVACLNLLINSTSNDPPRNADCFECGEKVSSFARLMMSNNADDVEKAFGDDDGEAGKSLEFATPTKNAVKTPTSSNSPTPSGKEQSKPGGKLSPFKNLKWSDTPPPSPAYSSDGSSPSTPSTNATSNLHNSTLCEIPRSFMAEWSVVRIDNIPWSLTSLSVIDWIPQSIISLDKYNHFLPKDKSRIKIHILCHRGDGRTLNLACLEFPLLAQAQQLVQLKHGKKMNGRIVGVSLGRQKELCEMIFPEWKFDKIDAISPEKDIPLISCNDLEALSFLFHLPNTHTRKVPERPFLQLMSIVEKAPGHQLEIWDQKLLARLLSCVECDIKPAAVKALEAKYASFEDEKDWRFTVTALINAVMASPVFRSDQKLKILSLVGLDSHPLLSHTPAPSSTQSHLHTPTSKSHYSIYPPSPSPSPPSAGHKGLPPSPLRFALKASGPFHVKANE